MPISNGYLIRSPWMDTLQHGVVSGFLHDLGWAVIQQLLPPPPSSSAILCCMQLRVQLLSYTWLCCISDLESQNGKVEAEASGFQSHPWVYKEFNTRLDFRKPFAVVVVWFFEAGFPCVALVVLEPRLAQVGLELTRSTHWD